MKDLSGEGLASPQEGGAYRAGSQVGDAVRATSRELVRRVGSLARAESVSVVLILLVGIAVRLWGINSFGFNTDEAVYAGQAAAIAQDPDLKEIFPIFRAHPLLVQLLLAVTFTFGVNDLLARVAAVAVGIATIFLVYRIASLLYGVRAGLIGALIIALMPYHVVVTRQVLLDGPMALITTLTLYLLVKFGLTQRAVWLYAAGASTGLAFLAKETSIILISAIYAFLALSPELRVRIRDLAISAAAMVLVIAPFPLSLLLAGGGGTERTQQYLVWQLLRRSNHEWDFYPSVVPPAIGLAVIALAIVGIVAWRSTIGWPEKLLIAWIVLPTVFFQLWPVKGFQYLIATAPPIAVLAARALALWAPRWVELFGRTLRIDWLRPAAIGLIAFSLFLPTWSRVQGATSDEFLAGTGGVPGGREAGLWLRENTPEGATLMTIGPSMANILQFYGHRRAYGLSVSPDPLHRNPAYDPLKNPDLLIRSNDLQYAVWDSFSAARSEFFSDGLMQLVRRYHGRAIHTETARVRAEDGSLNERPVIVIYEVRP